MEAAWSYMVSENYSDQFPLSSLQVSVCKLDHLHKNCIDTASLNNIRLDKRNEI